MPSLLTPCPSAWLTLWSRARAAALSVGIAATLLTVPSASAEDENELRERRSAVTDRIVSADEQVAESSKRLTAATRVLERVQARLSSAQARLAETPG